MFYSVTDLHIYNTKLLLLIRVVHKSLNVSQTYNNPVSLPLVLDPMAPTELGMTLTHEHLILDYSTKIMKPRYVPDNLRDLILKMENLGKIHHFP